MIMIEGFKTLSNDFTAMSAAIDTVSSEINDVIGILQNPNVNNNDQVQIDALTSRLSAVGNALKATMPAGPAPVVETAPVEAPVVDDGGAGAATAAGPSA